MNTSSIVQDRADALFAELKGLSLFSGDSESLEQKDMEGNTELKVRRVRTPAGVRRFKQPIGAIITNKGRNLDNLRIMDSVYDGWDLVAGRNKKRYDVGKDGGKWRAYGHNDWDDLVAEADSEDELYEKLNDLSAPPKKKPKPEAKPKPRSVDHTGGKRNERSRRPINVRTADDEEQDAQRQTAKRNDGDKDELDALKKAQKRTRKQILDDLTTSERRDVEALDKDAYDQYMRIRQGKLAVANRPIPGYYAGKAKEEILNSRHEPAYQRAKRNDDIGKRNKKIAKGEEVDNLLRHGMDRLKKYNGVTLPSFKKKGYEEVARERYDVHDIANNIEARLKKHHSGEAPLTDSLVKELEASLADAQFKAKAYDALYDTMIGPNASKRNTTSARQNEEVQKQGARQLPKSTQRAMKIANERHGANKPKAERTDAEIEAGLNNAFRKQFDTLSGSQKRKYFAAFRQGKTHSEAMAAARGDAGKAQGTLF